MSKLGQNIFLGRTIHDKSATGILRLECSLDSNENFVFVVTLVTFFVCISVLIFGGVGTHTQKTDPALLIQQQQQQQQPNQNRARRKLAKMVLSFVVLFAVCFLPIHVFFLWFYFHPAALQQYNGFWHTLKIAGFVLAYINSCINPIALYCVSTSFRKHFNRLLCCCRADRDGSNISHSGPVSYCGGSMCAGNNSRGAGTALMSDDPTVITHRSNSRRQNTIITSVNRRNHNENHHRNAEADEIPLNEIHQQQPQAPLDKQSSC